MTTGLLNSTHIVILLIVVLIVLGPKRLTRQGARSAAGRGNSETASPDATSPQKSHRRRPHPRQRRRRTIGAGQRIVLHALRASASVVPGSKVVSPTIVELSSFQNISRPPCFFTHLARPRGYANFVAQYV
jgi:Sec-independent protein translocase protein TatA